MGAERRHDTDQDCRADFLTVAGPAKSGQDRGGPAGNDSRAHPWGQMKKVAPEQLTKRPAVGKGHHPRPLGFHADHVPDFKGVTRDRRTGDNQGHHGRPFGMNEKIVIDKEGQDRQHQQRKLHAVDKTDPPADPEKTAWIIGPANPVIRLGASHRIGPIRGDRRKNAAERQQRQWIG